MLEHKTALMETAWVSTTTGEFYETAEQAIEALRNGERLQEMRRFYADSTWSRWTYSTEFSR